NRTASFAVTPARHDERAGQDSCALLARPPDGCQKLIGAVRLPIGKEKPGIRRQGVYDLGAQNTVLAVLGFEVAVRTERSDGNLVRQSPPQVSQVTSEAGIKNGDFDAAPAVTGGVPAVGAEPGQVLQPRLNSIRIRRSDGFRRRFLDGR